MIKLLFLSTSQNLSSRHTVVCQQPRKQCGAKVFFTGIANSPFSTPCISITTALICFKFTYYMPSIYTTLHTKCERNQLSSSLDVFLKIAPHFSSSHHFTKVTLSQPMIPFSWIDFFYIWHTCKALCGLL